MIINVQHSGLRMTHKADTKIENEIIKLQEMAVIDEANVRLERQQAGGPKFSVSVHLVTPGPDVRIVEKDQTLEAAMRKAVAQLRRSLEFKARRRSARVRSNLQLPGEVRMRPTRPRAAMRG